MEEKKGGSEVTQNLIRCIYAVVIKRKHFKVIKIIFFHPKLGKDRLIDCTAMFAYGMRIRYRDKCLKHDQYTEIGLYEIKEINKHQVLYLF